MNLSSILTFLDGADFLNILLELHADLADHTAVPLAHLSSQERAFGGHSLACGWQRVANRQLGLSFLSAYTCTKSVLDSQYLSKDNPKNNYTNNSHSYYINLISSSYIIDYVQTNNKTYVFFL